MTKGTDKIYFLLFFLLGFTWFSHSIKFAWPVMCLLVAFYFLHRVISVKGKAYISNSYMPFLLLGTFLVFHCMASNLEQLMLSTQNVSYRTWSGISTGARMFMDVSCLYVMFRCISCLRNEGSGLFFEGFSNGANLFLVMFLIFGRFSYEGMITAHFALEQGKEGFYFLGEGIGINNTAPLFLQFFFMNLLAYIYGKHSKIKLYHAIFCVLDLIFMFFMQSKTSMGALIISMTVIFIIKKPKYLIAVLIAGVYLISFFFNNADNIAKFLPARYNPSIVSMSISGGATGRTNIWRMYLAHGLSVKTLLMGYGYGCYPAVLYQKHMSFPDLIDSFNRLTMENTVRVDRITSHSLYVAMFIDQGGIFFIFYVFIMLKILTRLVVGVVRKKIHWTYLSIYIVLILESTFQEEIFSNMFMLSYAVVLPEVCNNVDKNHRMITIKDFYGIFLNRKKIIASVTIALMTLSLWHCLYSPTIYRSRAIITPSKYSAPLGRFPGTIIARILRGPTIVAKTAEKFDLMTVYGKCTMTETVDYMMENIIHANDTLLGYKITFEILDTSPDRAVKISNFMLDCLNEHMHKIYATANSGYSALYTYAADKAMMELIEAEDSFVQFQKANGITLAQSQVNSLLQRITSMRSEISAKEREIYTLMSYASSENVRLKLAQAQLKAMKNELAELEASRENFSLWEVPAAMTGYRDRLRKVEFLRLRLLEAMQALENVKNDLREHMPPVYIIDAAHKSVEKFKPYKTAVMIIGTCTGLSLGILLSVLDYKFRKA